MTIHYAHFDGTNLTLPTTGTQAIYQLATFLLEATGATSPAGSGGPAWTCGEAGDGLGVHTKAAGAFATTFSGATPYGSGANCLGNTDAYFVLTSPTGTHSWLFQRGSTDLLWRVKVTPISTGYSTTSGVTFAVPPTTTGGTTSALGTDDKVILGGGTDGSPTFATLFDTNGTYRWNLSADDASPYTWVAWSTVSGSASSSACHTLLAFDYAQQANTLDQEPWMYGCWFSTSNPAHHTTNPGLAWTFQFWQCRNVTGQVWVTSAGAWVQNFWAPGSVPFGDGDAPVSPYTDGSDFTVPCVVGNTTSGQGLKGVSTLFVWESPARNVGSLLTSGTLYSLGYACVRWDGSTPVT